MSNRIKVSHGPIPIVLLLFTCASPVAAEESALSNHQSLKPAVALALAQAAQNACRSRDFQVSVAVVDRSGILQVMLRDELAGNFSPEIATRKAVTAAGFRRDTLALAESLAARPALLALQQVEGALILGGGIPVEVDGAVTGAVGVSGAPTPEDDHACAAAAIDAVAADLSF